MVQLSYLDLGKLSCTLGNLGRWEVLRGMGSVLEAAWINVQHR